jgi:hypothetical protein
MISVPSLLGANASWLHRHSEVMAKELRDDGRLGMTVRADATNAEGSGEISVVRSASAGTLLSVFYLW